MKKYIKPQTNVVMVEAEAMIAASPSEINTTLLPQDNTITNSNEILSKKYSVWGDDEEE